MNKYVSIDIGGTAIKYGIIYEDAEIICKRSMKTEAWKGGPAILQKVTGIVEEMKQEAQEEMLRSWELAKMDGFLEPFIEHHGLLRGLIEALYPEPGSGGVSADHGGCDFFQQGLDGAS